MTDNKPVPLAPMPMEELDAFERWFYSVEEHARWSCLTPAYALAAKSWMAGRATVQPAAAQGWQPSEVWAGCGDCDVAFPCHEGRERCLRLPPEEPTRG